MLYETTLTRELANRYRAAGWWPDRLLNDAVARAIAQHPGRTALVDSRGRMTYAELEQQADQCGSAGMPHNGLGYSIVQEPIGPPTSRPVAIGQLAGECRLIQHDGLLGAGY